MNYEKVKLFLAFSGLLEGLTQEQDEYIVGEMRNHFTDEELRKIHNILQDSDLEFDELVESLIQDLKNVLFK